MDLLIDKNAVSNKNIILQEKRIFDLEINYYQNQEKNLIDNIYLGRITNVLPKMKAIFVDIGEEKNAYLDFKDLKESIDPRKVAQKYYNGKELFVQVSKNPVDQKGAKVTEKISLASNHLVLLPMSNRIYISRKIDSPEKRNDIRKMLAKINTTNYGVIARTSSEHASIDILEKEFNYLFNQYKQIEHQKHIISKNRLVYDGKAPWEVMLQKYFGRINRIYTNDSEVFDVLKNLYPKFNPSFIEESLVKKFQLTNKLKQLYKRKVHLESGISLSIDQTEALTIIDVNSSKFTSNHKNTLYEVNKKALIEVARQLVVRNIGGIILIDLINLYTMDKKRELVELFKNELRRYSITTEVYGFTKTGLLEMTKKYVGAQLIPRESSTCPVCCGEKLQSKYSIADTIVDEIKNILKHTKGRKLLVNTRKDVIAYFKENEAIQKFIHENELVLSYDVSRVTKIHHKK